MTRPTQPAGMKCLLLGCSFEGPSHHLVSTALLPATTEGTHMSGITRRYVDSRKVQQGDAHHYVTIPAKIVDELGIEKGDDLLFECGEGEESAEILSPSR